MEYDFFLRERREIMAQVIRDGFESIGASPGSHGRLDSVASSPDGPADSYLHPEPATSNESPSAGS